MTHPGRPFPLTRKNLRALIVLASVCLLGACGSEGQDPMFAALRGVAGTTISGVTGAIGGGDAAAPTPAVTAATVPQQLLDQIDGPLLLVENVRLGSAALMTRVGTNADTETWRGAEGWSVAMNTRGVLRSTRGLGFDLMASNVDPTTAALAAGRSGPVQRLQVHLDGDLEETRRIHDCTLRNDGRDTVVIAGRSLPLTRLTESCTVGDDAYENLYWVNSAGIAVQSTQWAGPDLGHFRITRLR
jgi:hypothetical protein